MSIISIVYGYTYSTTLCSVIVHLHKYKFNIFIMSINNKFNMITGIDKTKPTILNSAVRPKKSNQLKLIGFKSLL